MAKINGSRNFTLLVTVLALVALFYARQAFLRSGQLDLKQECQSLSQTPMLAPGQTLTISVGQLGVCQVVLGDEFERLLQHFVELGLGHPIVFTDKEPFDVYLAGLFLKSEEVDWELGLPTFGGDIQEVVTAHRLVIPDWFPPIKSMDLAVCLQIPDVGVETLYIYRNCAKR